MDDAGTMSGEQIRAAARDISALLKSHHPEQISPVAYAEIQRVFCRWIDDQLLPYCERVDRALQAAGYAEDRRP